LVVLGEAAVVDASHVRISHCETYTNVYEIVANIISALDALQNWRRRLLEDP
jgi:hypothetical protein